MQVKNDFSLYDIIGFIAEIQTSFTENFKELETQFDWKITDARLQIFYNCCELAANSRLTIGLLGYSKKDLYKKEWWKDYTLYDIDRAFVRIPNFSLYIDDKCRQLIHRVQEQLLMTTQIYIESFIRNLARQYSIEENLFWKLKKSFLIESLGFTVVELEPLTVYQHLKNSLHNRGLHYDPKNPELEFDIDGCVFSFKDKEGVKISWAHVCRLIIANSDLLKKIITHQNICILSEFTDKTVVILNDDE